MRRMCRHKREQHSLTQSSSHGFLQGWGSKLPHEQCCSALRFLAAAAEQLHQGGHRASLRLRVRLERVGCLV